MNSPRLPIIGAALLFVVAVVAIAFGSHEIGMTLSLASVGIVVAGKEIDSITSLSDLQEMRNNVYTQMQELRNKYSERSAGEGQPGKWEDDEEKRWKEANVQYDALTKRMESLRNHEAMETEFRQKEEAQNQNHRDAQGRHGRGGDINDPNNGQRQVTSETRALAFQGWLMRQMEGDISDRQRDAMETVGRAAQRSTQRFRMMQTSEYRSMAQLARTMHPSERQARLNAHFEQRALSHSTGGLGAELIPEGFVRQIEINMLDFSGVMQAADMLRTMSGNPIPWPTGNDTQNKGRLIGENTKVGNTRNPNFKPILFGAYKFTSDAILVPYELLEDEYIAPELPTILADMLAERLGRIKEQFYTNGTGVDQPEGVVTASTLGLTTASATAVSADEILQIQHRVDPAYRSGAAYMMHDSIIEAVRLIKDNEGNFLWQSGLRDGRPDMLAGRMLYLNQEMSDTIATGNKIMLFGDFKKFKCREVNNMRLYRLEERYRDDDQDGLVAFCRGDSRLINAGTPPIAHTVVG